MIKTSQTDSHSRSTLQLFESKMDAFGGGDNSPLPVNVDALLGDSWEEPKETPANKSRKRGINKNNWAKNKAKKRRRNDEPIQHCSHVHDDRGFCKLITLTNEDLFGFRDKFLRNVTAVDQRKFIQRNITVQLPQRNRVSDFSRKRIRGSTTSFFIQAPNRRVQVCKKAFGYILGVGRRQIENAAKAILEPDELMVKRRGGARQNPEKQAQAERIINHIKSFRCREHHYSRNKTPLRAYLPSDLCVKKMWALFKEQDPDCKYNSYYTIFCRKFNLAFGSPKTDVCSTCVRLKTARFLERDDEKKKSLILEHAVHIRRAKMFFIELNSHPESSITINFDLMQNQPLPRTPVGEAFYARQLWCYILGVVIHDEQASLAKENVHFYRWLESEYGRGANLIISCLSHFLNKVLSHTMENRPAVTTIRFFCDSCASQNKKYAMALMLMKFCANKKLNFQWYFPVRGHSYMPADRAFGLVEKKLRKIDTIVDPKQYDEVLKEVGTLHTSREFMVHTWTETSKSVLKTGEKGFKISECKKISYSHENPNYLQVQPNYTGPNSLHKITKKKYSDLKTTPFNLKLVKKANQMSSEKMNDVETLLTTMGVDWKNHEFYRDVLKKTPNVVIPRRANNEDPENNISFYSEDEESVSID